MKKLLAPTAAIAALVVLAPTANANPQDFLNDLYDHGWYSDTGSAALVADGYRVCQMLNSTTGDVVARYVYENTGVTVTRSDAMEFVVFAVEDLCPWHDHRTTSNAGV